MNPLDTEFHRRLAARLDEEIARESAGLISGALDHLSYMRTCGRIKALMNAKEWCEAIESEMNQGK